MMEALRQMAIRDGRLPAKIKEVMLAAPDIDVDIFRQQLNEIGDRRPPFTVFVSQDDSALALSKHFWSGGRRLGAIDPHAEPYRSDFERLRVDLFDLTDVKSANSMNHGKFATAPEVVQLIGTRLAGGQNLSDSNVGLSERIGIVGSEAETTFDFSGLIDWEFIQSWGGPMNRRRSIEDRRIARGVRGRRR